MHFYIILYVHFLSNNRSIVKHYTTDSMLTVNAGQSFIVCTITILSIACNTYGLLTECLWFLYAILANCSRVVPYFFMCSIPAFPNNWAAIGAASSPASSDISPTCLSSGLVLSINFEVKLPLSIFSKPTARTQSYRPDSIDSLANSKAEAPVEQLFETLKMGIPVIPTS